MRDHQRPEVVSLSWTPYSVRHALTVAGGTEGSDMVGGIPPKVEVFPAIMLVGTCMILLKRRFECLQKESLSLGHQAQSQSRARVFLHRHCDCSCYLRDAALSWLRKHAGTSTDLAWPVLTNRHATSLLSGVRGMLASLVSYDPSPQVLSRSCPHPDPHCSYSAPTSTSSHHRTRASSLNRVKSDQIRSDQIIPDIYLGR